MVVAAEDEVFGCFEADALVGAWNGLEFIDTRNTGNGIPVIKTNLCSTAIVYSLSVQSKHCSIYECLNSVNPA